MNEEKVDGLKNAALEAAAAHIRGQRTDLGKYRFKAICFTVAACVALVCAAVVACFAIHTQQQTIIEQQYALNMQYAQLTDLLSGAEVTTTEEVIDGSNGVATKIEGDGNTVSGGGN